MTRPSVCVKCTRPLISVACCAITEEPGPARLSEPALSRLTLLVPHCLSFVVLGKKQWEKGLIGDKSKQ